MYNRFDKGMHPKQSVLDQLLSCVSQKMKLEDNATELENVSSAGDNKKVKKKKKAVMSH